MPWKRKRCWTADASCRLDSSFTPQYDSELDLGSPEALIHRDEESSDRSYRDSCCRRLSSPTVRRKESFTPGQACRRIFCACQIGSACEGLQKQNARSSRFHNSLLILGAARDKMHDPLYSRARCFFLGAVCANSFEPGSAPRCNGSCRCHHLSTIPAGSRIKCLGMGVLGREPLLWPNRQYLRLRTRSLDVRCGCGRKLLPSCPRTGTSNSGTTSATAPSPRACPRSLPVRSSPFHSRKSPHQIRLALPQRGRTHRVRHHDVPGHCQLLMEAAWKTGISPLQENTAPVLHVHRGRVCPGLESFYTSSSGHPVIGLEVLSSTSTGSLSTGARTESLI